MDLPFELKILERIQAELGLDPSGHKSREVNTILLMPIMPIDVRFDPKDLIGASEFPALIINPEDSTPVSINNNGFDVILEINVDAVVAADPDQLLYAYTALGKHIMERMLYQREGRYHTPPKPPLGLDRVIDIIPSGSQTVSKEAQAATDTFTRRFTFDIKYRASYEDIQTHDRNR